VELVQQPKLFKALSGLFFAIHLGGFNVTDVMGRVRQSTVPVKLLAIGGIAFLILAILPFVAGEFQANLMAKLLLFGVLGVSLDLVWGFTGILSFAHGVFFTLGGYAMAYYLKLNLAASANTYGVALPDLIRVLQSTNTNVKLAAVRAMGRLGSSTRSAVPELMSSLQEAEEQEI